MSLAQLRDTLRAVVELTYRPWFERAWAFQEAVLPSAVSLIGGELHMPFESLDACFRQIFLFIQQLGSLSISEAANLIFDTRLIEDTYPQDSGRLPGHYLKRLLASRWQARMLDARGYIFSLLGLFSPLVRQSLSPNYSISIKDLFIAVAKHVMRFSDD